MLTSQLMAGADARLDPYKVRPVVEAPTVDNLKGLFDMRHGAPKEQ